MPATDCKSKHSALQQCDLTWRRLCIVRDEVKCSAAAQLHDSCCFDRQAEIDGSNENGFGEQNPSLNTTRLMEEHMRGRTARDPQW